MNEPVNIVDLMRRLPSRPRGRACIVLTHDYDDQKEWAAELARQTDSDHTDLLALFAEDQGLGGNLGRCTVSWLFDFLKERSSNSVLIVSGLEFLKATWAGLPSAVEEFAAKIEFWDERDAPALLFVLQYDKALALRAFRRFRQHTFVVDRRETLAL